MTNHERPKLFAVPDTQEGIQALSTENRDSLNEDAELRAAHMAYLKIYELLGQPIFKQDTPMKTVDGYVERIEGDTSKRVTITAYGFKRQARGQMASIHYFNVRHPESARLYFIVKDIELHRTKNVTQGFVLKQLVPGSTDEIEPEFTEADISPLEVLGWLEYFHEQ